MPVAVAQPNRDSSDNQALLGALGIAKDLFKVGMDERQARRADELSQKRVDAQSQQNALELDRQNRLDTQNAQDRAINHLKDWEPAKEGTPGAVALPGYQGLFLPRSIREKEKDRAAKSKENSAVENKQIGIAELGLKAEEQFRKAVADKKEYDPTQPGQLIDNSTWAPNWMKNDKAIEAQAAMSNWVEAYLRDASGAAIPPSERMAYAKDFFPMPGDPPSAVANKQAMREQKMRNALMGGNIDQKKIEEKISALNKKHDDIAGKNGFGEASASSAPAVQEVRRLDPNTGKTAIFNAVTKEFIRYAE